MAVMIGIDPNKRSHTAVAIDGADAVLGQLRVTADRRQLHALLAFAAPWRLARELVELEAFNAVVLHTEQAAQLAPKGLLHGVGAARRRGVMP